MGAVTTTVDEVPEEVPDDGGVMDAKTATWLTSDDAAPLLALARDAASPGVSELTVQTKLRAAGHRPERVAAVMALASARRRAVDKFGPAAGSLFLTLDGIEQATRPQLAARHAGRFVAAGVEEVIDLGCGLGSDAAAFAAAGLGVVAVESDPVTATFAAANLSVWPRARVVAGLAEETPLPEGEAGRHTGLWVDPGRRTTGVSDVRGRTRRVFSLDGMSPTWDDVRAWAALVPATGAKLSPAFPHGAVPDGSEAQWTSWRGEVLECAIWWGPLAAVPGRTAAVCRPGPDTMVQAVVTDADAARGEAGSSEPITSAAELGAWLWEADRAVIRAGLTGAMPGRELGPGMGLSTGNDPVDLPWTRRYAVVEPLPARAKAVRSWLRARGIGSVTIKRRGSAIDPDRFRSDLGRLSGTERATVLLTSAGHASLAVIVSPAE